MPKLTRTFRRRFNPPGPQTPQEGLPAEKGIPPAKFKVGDFIQVYRITEAGHGDYLNNIGRVTERYWDPAKRQWTYTAYTVGQEMAINPVEKEAKLYRMPKSAAQGQPLASSAQAFPAPKWLAADEKEEWQAIFGNLFASGNPVAPSLVADPLTQLAVFAQGIRRAAGVAD